jgi:lipoprotein signal peptidase
MKLFSRRLFMIVICGFLFVLDRFLKWQALHEWSNDFLLNRFFGWHPFLNPGVAFGLPVPTSVVVVLTIPILFLLAYLFWQTHIPYPVSRIPVDRAHGESWGTGYGLRVMGYPLIFAGALSNLLDRILYNHTVDYFLILTAVINLADVMIVVGFVIYWLYKSEARNPKL